MSTGASTYNQYCWEKECSIKTTVCNYCGKQLDTYCKCDSTDAANTTKYERNFKRGVL